MVPVAGRTLTAVFKASGVAKAYARRFRHTLARELLALGGSIQDAADILGDSLRIVEKRYVK
jgi:hypothetical protein